MSREELFAAFEELFPDWAKKATSYKKIGSKCLAIRFNNGTSRVFLFENPNNWHFGTKLWRKRPDEAEKKKEIKEDNNGGEKDTPIQSEEESKEWLNKKYGINKEVKKDEK